VPGSDIEKEILSKSVPICKTCGTLSNQSKNKKKKRKRRSWDDDDDDESDDITYPPHVMKVREFVCS